MTFLYVHFLLPSPQVNCFNPTSNVLSSHTDVWPLQGEPPPRVQLVEEATEAVGAQFPELWRLGQAYFGGELQVKVQAGQHARFKVSRTGCAV